MAKLKAKLRVKTKVKLQARVRLQAKASLQTKVRLQAKASVRTKAREELRRMAMAVPARAAREEPKAPFPTPMPAPNPANPSPADSSPAAAAYREVLADLKDQAQLAKAAVPTANTDALMQGVNHAAHDANNTRLDTKNVVHGYQAIAAPARSIDLRLERG